MHKNISSILLSALCCCIFAAVSCQANNYKIEGSCEGMQDGDTLFLTTDIRNRTPFDTTIVKEGRFELSNQTDTTCIAILYSKKNERINIPLFLEPGRIKVNIDAAGMGKLAGTRLNERYQEMNDSLFAIGKRIEALGNVIESGKLLPSEIEKKKEEYKQLMKYSNQVLLTFAEKNADNELGVVIMVFYNDFSIAEQEKILSLMPESTRKRPEMKRLQATIDSQKKTAEGSIIPDFVQDDINGQPVSLLSEVKKHKITIVDFWASWCGPCRAEMPSLVRLYSETKDQGLGIIGISFDNNKEAWQAAIKHLGITWTQLSDLKGWENAIGMSFAVRSIPYTLVLDQEGKILKKGLRGEELADFVKSHLQ